MHSVELAVLNLKETRRRSIKLWRSLPDSWLGWRTNAEAFSFSQMIRHVWEGSYHMHMVMSHGGDVFGIVSQPFEDGENTSVDREIELSKPYFEDFIS